MHRTNLRFMSIFEIRLFSELIFFLTVANAVRAKLNEIVKIQIAIFQRSLRIHVLSGIFDM